MGYNSSNSSTLGVCSMSTVSKPVFLQIYHAFKRVFYCTSGRGDILHNVYFYFHFRVFSIDLHLFLFSLTSLRLLFRFILITLEFIIFFLTGSTTTSADISLLLIVAKLADPVLIVVSLFLAEMFYFYSFDNCSFFQASTTTFADTRIAPFSATNSCQLLLAILSTTYF